MSHEGDQEGEINYAGSPRPQINQQDAVFLEPSLDYRRGLRRRPLADPDLDQQPPVQRHRGNNVRNDWIHASRRLEENIVRIWNQFPDPDDVPMQQAPRPPVFNFDHQQQQQNLRPLFEDGDANEGERRERFVRFANQFWRHFEELHHGDEEESSDSEEDSAEGIPSLGFKTWDYMPEYVKNALRIRKENSRCPLCNRTVKNSVFLKHAETCKGGTRPSFEERAKAISLFKCRDHYVNDELASERDKQEIQYFEATLDPACRQQMACRTCITKNEHLDGKCMNDNMKTAFSLEANRIVQSALNEYSRSMEYRREIGLAHIAAEFAAEREANLELPAEEPANIALEVARQMMLGHLETNDAEKLQINKFNDEIDVMLERNYRTKHESFTKLVDKHSKRMAKYIKTFKGKRIMKDIVQYRRNNNMHVLTEERNERANRKRTRENTVGAARGRPSSLNLE